MKPYLDTYAGQRDVLRTRKRGGEELQDKFVSEFAAAGQARRRIGGVRENDKDT